MPQSNEVTLADKPEQLELSDEQLAGSLLDRRIADTQKKLSNAGNDLLFTQTYDPTPPGPQPHPEAGGMDHSDWNVANLEYQQWPHEQEQDIERLESEIDHAEYELLELFGLREQVEAGDKETISNLASQEHAHLAEQERLATLNEERKGKVFEGAAELLLRLMFWKTSP